MPLYDYNCRNCGNDFESWESSGNTTEACPDCESILIERLVPLIGGYQGDLGSASTKPRGAGAFSGRKGKS